MIKLNEYVKRKITMLNYAVLFQTRNKKNILAQQCG